MQSSRAEGEYNSRYFIAEKKGLRVKKVVVIVVRTEDSFPLKFERRKGLFYHVELDEMSC